jgi:hypothetical protein
MIFPQHSGSFVGFCKLKGVSLQYLYPQCGKFLPYQVDQKADVGEA